MFQGNASTKTDTEENNENPVRTASTPDETSRYEPDKSVLVNMYLGDRQILKETLQGTFVGIILESGRGKGGHTTFERGQLNSWSSSMIEWQGKR
jgi:hypothetical protein